MTTTDQLHAGVRWLRDLARYGRTDVTVQPDLLLAMAQAIEASVAVRVQLADVDGSPLKVLINGHFVDIQEPEIDDVHVAIMIRMLMRDDPEHERICTLARDRLMWHAQRREADQIRHGTRVDALKAMLRDAGDVLERGLSLMETVEAKALVGDEGCLWPVELARDLIARIGAGGDGPFRPTHRHYKGGLYEVLYRATIEADLHAAVVYRDSSGTVWIRDSVEFFGTMPDGKPRFATIQAAGQ